MASVYHTRAVLPYSFERINAYTDSLMYIWHNCQVSFHSVVWCFSRSYVKKFDHTPASSRWLPAHRPSTKPPRQDGSHRFQGIAAHFNHPDQQMAVGSPSGTPLTCILKSYFLILSSLSDIWAICSYNLGYCWCVYTGTADSNFHRRQQNKRGPLLENADIIPLLWSLVTHSIMILLTSNLVQCFIYSSSIIVLSYMAKNYGTVL